MTADLRQLWQEAFGDPAETLDAFFATGFSEDRHHCILENGVPVSALYWFDCELDGSKLAYLYAVATKKSHRGKGLAHKLMNETHAILKDRGYAGAILVPGGESLFDFYEKLGYRAATEIHEFSCTRADTPVALQQVDAAQYARLRENLLPESGVTQEGAALNFLQTQVKLYAGKNCLLAASVNNNTLQVQEFLGDPTLAPHILHTLNCPEGHFRTPGNGKAFAMLLPFVTDCPQPGYFGLALD